MNINNLLEEQGSWSQAGSNLGELLNVKIQTSISRANGELKRVELVEDKTTELFKLKLDLKIQELRNELNDITPAGGQSSSIDFGSIPSQDKVEASNDDEPLIN